ncbi:MAG: nitroreductase [Actinomycetota bacterium]|jgi:nitroreductase|nr:nitroreductase [Actinomycetota bacterium]
MDVLDAIRHRTSIRAFKPDPVPRETIEELLEIAQRSPSGTNTQPWHVYVCSGSVKEAITADVLAMAQAGTGGAYEDFDYYPAKWNDIHTQRRRGVGWSLYNLVGVEKGDREGSARQAMRNFLFFDAPVGIFVTTDSYLTRGSWAATGMYLQTIMLAAKGMGLDTCPQAAWIPYQEPVLRHLGVPEDQALVSGMSLGWADHDKIENTLVSEREDVQNVADFLGFD